MIRGLGYLCAPCAPDSMHTTVCDRFHVDPGSRSSLGLFLLPDMLCDHIMQVAIQDVVDTTVAVFKTPAVHAGSTLNIAGPAWSWSGAAAAFSVALGRPIEYMQVSHEGFVSALQAKGFQLWELNGILEWFADVDAGLYHYDASGIVKALAGHEPTSVQQWVETAKSGFL